MHSIITRKAGLVLAFGLFFGCSSLIKPTSNTEQPSRPLNTLSTQALKTYIADLDESIEDGAEHADTYLMQGKIASELASRQTESSAKTVWYQRMKKPLQEAKKLYEQSDDTAGIHQVDDLLQQAWNTEYTQAIRISQSEKNNKKALTHFNNATIIIADSLAAYTKQAALLYKMEDTEKAIEVLRKGQYATPSPSVALLEQLGYLYLETQEPWKAIKVYQQALDTAEQPTTVLPGLANAHIAAGNHSKAVDLIDRLIKADRDNAYYWQTMGKELYLLGKKHLENYLNAAGNDRQGNEYVHKAQSAFEEAEDAFEQALDIAPNSTDLKILAGGVYQNMAVDFEHLLLDASNRQKRELKKNISHYLNNAIPLLRDVAENHDPQYWGPVYEAYTYLGMDQQAQRVQEKMN